MDKINFGPDKSQILRGIAIVFMILLHNNCGGLFKICVPIFTFLVGYGYAFAKEKNLSHAITRSWHLLSHFWLILLAIFLPVAICTGGYKATVPGVLEEMFGLESHLNWYSWYIYFYIYAMIVMVPASRIIAKFKIWGTLGLILTSFVCMTSVHMIPGWSENIWTQAIFDCFLSSPCMFVGCYLAEGGVVTSLKLPKKTLTAVISVAIMVGIFFARGWGYAYLIDWILTPAFCVAAVLLFNIVTGWLPELLIKLGKQSMNMWFIHALFYTTCTATVFAPLLFWIQPHLLMVAVMILFSYYASILINRLYHVLGTEMSLSGRKL